MTKYVPFLKLKQNEIMALKEVDLISRDFFVPFFDYARREYKESEVNKKKSEGGFEAGVSRLLKSCAKNIGFLKEFYLDNFDLSDDLFVGGEFNYRYLLSKFSSFPVIPVLGIDRVKLHLDSVHELKSLGILRSKIVAFRITEEDFEDFNSVHIEIKNLAPIFALFEGLDLVLDCRVCRNSNSTELAQKVARFVSAFIEYYEVRRVIVTGSSLPASIAEIAAVSREKIIDRVELNVYRRATSLLSQKCNLIYGDYATVSPNYSDPNVPQYALRNITAPKVIYTFDDHQFIKRGTALATHPLGNRQYESILAELVKKPFFRKNNSWGDRYIVEKSEGQGSDAAPGTMVKPLCNSHITFICQQL